MCCFLNARDRRQVGALSRRWFTVVPRRKMDICKSLTGAILISMVWIFVWGISHGQVSMQHQLALDYYQVANPSMLVQKSNFCRTRVPSDASNIYECVENEAEDDMF